VGNYDAVVVGSGAAGGWAAKELCEGGLDVLVVEAGRAIDPVVDFPVPAPPERRLTSRLVAAARGQHVQLRCTAFNARTRRFFVSDRENPYTTPRGSPFNWFRGRQVGGRLHVWGRVALRLSERELGDWPIAYDELSAYYGEVEEFLDVRDAVLTSAEERFATDVEPLVRVVPTRIAAHDPGRVPRTIRAADATGRLTLRSGAVARRLSLDARAGRATGVEIVDRRGRAQEECACVVVLCASTIETLRILLNSGVGNSSGRLGSFLVDHVMTGIGGPLSDGADRVETADPYDLGTVTGFTVPRGSHGVQGGIGRGSPSWYMFGYAPMAGRAENRVTLDAGRTDRWGVPLAHIECAHGPEDSALAAEQLELMAELAAAAGLPVRTPPSGRALDRLAFRFARRGLASPSGAFLPGSAAHEVGGAGMGDDPAVAVTDPYGRLWDADNVIVADGAAFPSGGWENVTLTIMALALRAARRVRADHLEGRL
jgi:choline dehydrogenase-like flavoprotein